MDSSSTTTVGPNLEPGWHEVSCAVDLAFHEQNADGTWRELAAWTEDLADRLYVEGFAAYHDFPALYQAIDDAITIDPVTIEDRENGSVAMTLVVHCAFDVVRFRILSGPSDRAIYDEGGERWMESTLRTSDHAEPTGRTYTWTITLSERLPMSSLTIPFRFHDVAIDGTDVGRLRDPIEITIPLP